MPGSTGPLISRRRVGSTFRRLREEKGEQLKDTAKALMFSTSKLSRIETGVLEPQPRDLRDLLVYFDLTDTGLGAEITEWVSEAVEAPWWTRRGFRMPPRLAEYLSYESPAAVIEEHSARFVPGTMQTPAYAAAVFSTVVPELSAADRDAQVALRMARREFLDSRIPRPRLICVIPEEVLHRPVGPPATQQEQLLSLLTEFDCPHTELRIVPYDAGTYRAVDGSFTVFTFDHPIDPPVVATASVSDVTFTDSPEIVHDHRSRFDDALARCLDATASRNFVESLIAPR